MLRLLCVAILAVALLSAASEPHKSEPKEGEPEPHWYIRNKATIQKIYDRTSRRGVGSALMWSITMYVFPSALTPFNIDVNEQVFFNDEFLFGSNGEPFKCKSQY
jgi:hypothetical protein